MRTFIYFELLFSSCKNNPFLTNESCQVKYPSFCSIIFCHFEENFVMPQLSQKPNQAPAASGEPLSMCVILGCSYGTQFLSYGPKLATSGRLFLQEVKFFIVKEQTMSKRQLIVDESLPISLSHEAHSKPSLSSIQNRPAIHGDSTTTVFT